MPTVSQTTGHATRRTPAERADLARLDDDSIASARRFWRANAPANRVGLIDAAVPGSGKASANSRASARVHGKASLRIHLASRSLLLIPPFAATDGAAHSGWRFLQDLRVFERVASGAKLAAEKVRQAVDFVSAAGQKAAARLAKALGKGKIDLPAWQAKMETLVKDAHGSTGLIGAGGIDAATTADVKKIEAAIAYQLKYLEDFATDIENGLPLDGRVPPRAAQYIGVTTQTYENVNRIGRTRAGFDWERRYVNSGMPCVSCVDYADAGWQPAGTLPDVGQDCECNQLCRCSFMYRTTDPYGGNDPPPVVLSPKPIKPPPHTNASLPERVAQVAKVKALHDTAYQAMAAEHGTTPEVVKAAVNAGFKAAVDSGEFYLRVDPTALPKILAAGRVKSQFETGTTDASYSPTVRADVEARLFGTPTTTTPKDRPVYGYVSRPDFASANAPAELRVSGYGDAVVRLNPKVRERATVTGSDSLGLNGHMVGVPATVPTGDAAPVDTKAFQRLYGDTLKSTADGGDWLDAIGSRLGYLEAQFHGGLRVRDIAEIGFPSPPEPTLNAALNAAGVPWRVLP